MCEILLKYFVHCNGVVPANFPHLQWYHIPQSIVSGRVYHQAHSTGIQKGFLVKYGGISVWGTDAVGFRVAVV